MTVSVPSRLPRLRGDGPGGVDGFIKNRESPPPARGWTLFRDLAKIAIHVSPACAGMDPVQPANAIRAIGLPRLRGDGPQHVVSENTVFESPPPARGWTVLAQNSISAVNVSPACAGMDPRSSLFSNLSKRLPRLRGDGPSLKSRLAKPSASPPPARGWTHSGRGRSGGFKVSPACAGMDPGRYRPLDRARRLPRLRGDGPESNQTTIDELRSPPPARGWTRSLRQRRATQRVSPACAGIGPRRQND